MIKCSQNPRERAYKPVLWERSAHPQLSLHFEHSPVLFQLTANMITLKFGTFLLSCVLIFCQMYISQAAPSSREDPNADGVTLSNDDIMKLLRAIKEFMQLASDEQERQTADGSSNTTAQKRGCNTATCVTHRLADFLSRSGGLGHRNFVPTSVGAQAFGKRRRRSPE
ncbi:calcitonin/calcitonin-related polypeptide, alpha isoform X3 [Phyllopteryx taeniolatus]|uniref:calcitonin/calcitonin-related polypeptide, alpha isoform X3 n=1 Tax=Phyllopteryx taeniolatus TaxID=161469 RepID=UPI002AD37848|nr:calcitonin/calcitonin-related polypeptide, alpha isoform X3 [Phyllopteryx taeniolatus]